MGKRVQSLTSSRPFYSFIGLLIIVVFAVITVADFRTADNFITILRQSSTLLILSTGLTAVLITGSMDLSVGATAGLVGCTCAQFLKMGTPIVLVFLLAVVLGGCIGLLNGFLVSVIRLPGFIATYATNWVISGISIIIMNGAVIYDLPPGFTFFGTGYLGPFPVIVIVASIIVGVAYFLLQKTTFGRRVYLCGSSANAARFSGVATTKITIGAFMFCSICAGLGGLMMTARLNAADAAMGDAYGLQTVAAVVIGGTSMLGGEGGVIGTIVGALLLTIIVNLMNLMDISSNAQPLVIGTVIIAMVLFDSYNRNRKRTGKQGKKMAV